jgi:protein-S-isoprenylcysteine O-methyltransferase Ste14
VTQTRVPSLGSRGEGWVVLQSIALLTAGVAGLAGPPWPVRWELARRVGGLALAMAGGALGIAGIRHLGDALTPYPRPADGAGLRESGVFRLVRHPIYGGLLLVSLGWASLTSPLALVPAASLAAIFEAKRRREEAWLTDRHPGYAAYARRVRRRFVPFVW